jgi:uncharacterized protein YjiS (DUF1127 family)
MTAIHLHPFANRRRPLPRRAADRVGAAIRHALATLELWRERVRARNELARLDRRALRDIGLSPSERDFLVNKPFWRE